MPPAVEAELPPAVEDVSAVDWGGGDTLRRVGRSTQVSTSSAQISAATLGVGVGQLIGGVHAHDAVDPAGGRIECGGRHDGLGEFSGGMHLQAAVGLRLQQSNVARRLHEFDRMVGEFADLLRLGTLVTHLIRDLSDVVDYPLGHDVVLSSLTVVDRVPLLNVRR